MDGDGDLNLVLHFRLEDTYLIDVYADLLRQDLADRKFNDNHHAVDVLLTGRATSNGDEYFDFLGEENVDLFLTGKMLDDFLQKL